MTAPTTSTLERRTLRDVFGHFATGVTIVTAYTDDQAPVGLTVNSFTSVSLEPALVLWSIQEHSPHKPIFGVGRRHGIHVLEAGQAAMATRFATAGADKFEGINLGAPETAPGLAHCLARLDCEVVQTQRVGDHELIIAQVTDYRVAEGEPLLFWRGRWLEASAGSTSVG